MIALEIARQKLRRVKEVHVNLLEAVVESVRTLDPKPVMKVAQEAKRMLAVEAALGIAALALAACAAIEARFPTPVVAFPGTATTAPVNTEIATQRSEATSTNAIKVTSTTVIEATVTAAASGTPEPTVTPHPQEIPVWARGKSLDGQIAGLGGPGKNPEIPLADDPRLQKLVEDGYQFIMQNGATGVVVELDVEGQIVRRIEAPALKLLTGEVDGVVTTFERPDVFPTGGIKYFNGEKMMVYGSWYWAGGKLSEENTGADTGKTNQDTPDLTAEYAGVARRPDGLLAAVYLLSDGRTAEVTGHVFGPMDLAVPTGSDAANNYILIDGQIVIDASLPVKIDAPPSEAWKDDLKDALAGITTNWIGENDRFGSGILVPHNRVYSNFMYASGGGVEEHVPLPGYDNVRVRTGTPAYYLHNGDLAKVTMVSALEFLDENGNVEQICPYIYGNTPYDEAGFEKYLVENPLLFQNHPRSALLTAGLPPNIETSLRNNGMSYPDPSNNKCQARAFRLMKAWESQPEFAKFWEDGDPQIGFVFPIAIGFWNGRMLLDAPMTGPPIPMP